MKIIKLVVLLSLFFGNLAYSQNKIINVNFSTGTANVVIPLYTLNSGNVSLPISLVYSATGVRTNDVEGSAGMGWNLNAGGAITRQLRGLPDDCLADISGNTKLGWMSSNNYAAGLVAAFGISNDSGTGNCTGQTNDINYINNYFPSNEDTEPDVFDVQAPGLVCKLVYDRQNQQFRTIPYMDLVINASMGSNGIVSFTLTNDKGLKYTFSAAEMSFQRATVASGVLPAYFGDSFNQYMGTTIAHQGQPYSSYDPATGMTTIGVGPTTYTYTGGISYVGAWDLSSIQDVYGNYINITYIQGTQKGSISPVNVFQGASKTPSGLYSLLTNNTPNLISQITYGNTNGGHLAFTFNWNTSATTQKSFINTIAGFGRFFQFSYNSIAYSGNTNNFIRNFLNNVVDPGCGTPFNYAFDYVNPTSLPDSTSSAVDYYGYYNGQDGNTSLRPDILINPADPTHSTYANPQATPSPSSNFTSTYTYEITGNNRKTAPLTNGMFPSTIGTLNKINYGNGGATLLSYEPNDYYDSFVGGVVLGSGIRVTQITDSEITEANPSGIPVGTTLYTYNDRSTGHSSGVPSSFPVFAFTTPYTGTATGSAQWIASTISSFSDLSPEDHTIFYGTATETLAGTGSTTHLFTAPSTSGSGAITAPSFPWQPTTVYAGHQSASNSSCPSIGLLTNGINSYPFPPNPNYDFEKGLPLASIQYNDYGQEVSETDYTYITPPTKTISALKFDFNNQTSSDIAAYNYAKYTINTSTGPLTTEVYKKLFDLGSTSSYQASAVNYAYNSTQHQLPTQISVTNSDNSVTKTNIQYVKDYIIPASATPGDNYTAGLQNLQLFNINIPVEKYNLYTYAKGHQDNQTTGATTAELTEFALFPVGTNTMAMPAQKLNFNISNSNVLFTPSGISSNYTFNKDPSYIPSENDFAYDYTGALLSKDNGFNKYQTILTNHLNGQPAIIINNAKIINTTTTSTSEFAVSDFDNFDNTYGFYWLNSSGGTIPPVIGIPGRVGNGGYFTQGHSLTQTITKSPLSNFYIFSVWINCGSPGALTITATGTGSNAVSNTSVINFTNSYIPLTPTGYRYYEVKIPLAGITSPTFTVTASANQDLHIDDVACYPDAAAVSSIGYDPTTQFKVAETNTNGVSTYYSVDTYGRINYVFDQDKNIIKRTTYSATNNIESFIGGGSYSPLYNVTPAFTTAANSSRTVTFVNTTFATPCVLAPTISWDFGDQATGTSTGSAPIQHTYSAAGTYTVVMKIINNTNPSISKIIKVN